VTARPIRQLVASMRSGEIEADAPVRGAASQIERRNAELNALVSLRTEEALREAADRVTPLGPLSGIPFTVKDMLATQNLPTTSGSRSLDGWRAGVDSTAVARMRAAGGVLVGKTNCPEFALGVDTNNDLFGRTFNPIGQWTPGGSSGGESAAVAAGMSLIGLGTDFGGSIRWPAQCTGIVGLRPTVGRVSRAGEQPTLPGSDPLQVETMSFQNAVQVVGLLARTIDDIDLGLRVIAGADGIDPLAVDEPLGDYRALRLSDIDVRWGVEISDVPVDSEVAAAVRTAADRLNAAGAKVTPGLPEEVSAGLAIYDRLRAADPMTAIAALNDRAPDLIGPPIKAMLAARVTIDETERAELWAARSRLVAGLEQWLTGQRVLILPVSVDVPRDLGGNISHFALLTPSRAISLFGVPAVSVPVSVSLSGAPISVQIVAPAFREDVALAVGAALEHTFSRQDRLSREASDAH
jgi:amidase